MQDILKFMGAITFILALGSAARAEVVIKPYQGSSTKTFAVDGKTVSEPEAFQAAIAGKNVTRCEQMEVTLNKNGTGATMKAKKK